MDSDLDPAVAPRNPSVEALIRHGARVFERHGLVYGHGTADATDDAAALVFHALGLRHESAAESYAMHPAAEDVQRVLRLYAERVERRVPAAYLMRRMWFAGLEFELDEHVLVPRSPIAELVLTRFVPWVDPARVRRILDIGTGSGCIAIACALAFPQARVDAVDLSAQALEVAARNAQRHAVGERMRLLQGDVYGPLGDERYDLIVSNPPYVSEAEMRELPQEYRHEPALALVAGVDGLSIARRILAGAARRLSGHGVLVVEVGDSDERLQRAYPDVPFTWLEFEHGGGGVFTLQRAELLRSAASLAASPE